MASKDILNERMTSQLVVKARTSTTRTLTGSRNQALAMAIPDESHSPVLKKRKLDNVDDAELRISRAAPSCIEVRSRRTTVNINHNSGSDHDDLASVSCCSRGGSSERAEFVDLEVNESVEAEISTCCREEEESSERELRADSYTVDSTPQKSTMASTAEQNSGRRKSTVVVEKMNTPLKFEIEEFFAEEEKKIKKEFVEKYNFNIVKEEPLQGRYKWVRMRNNLTNKQA